MYDLLEVFYFRCCFSGPVALVSGEVLSKGQRLTGSNPELSRATSLEPTGTHTTSRLATTHDYSVRVSS